MFIENQWWQLTVISVGVLLVTSILGAFGYAKQHNLNVGALRTLAFATVATVSLMATIYGYLSAAVYTNWGTLIIATLWALMCINQMADHVPALLREDDDTLA